MNSIKIPASCLAALCFMAQPLSALTFGKFTYSDKGTYISIDDYPDNESGDVVIPETIAGKPVTAIGLYAFSDCSLLTSVTIPNSVTSIAGYSFTNCRSLTSVTIPNSVTSIGTYSFAICNSLTSVTIPNSVTSIGTYSFNECTGLTSVTIPNSVTSIGEAAFRYCYGLTSVSIPNSVTSIGAYAFFNCYGMTSVSIPNSVTSIGAYAFYNCHNLTSVKIPNSVTSIGGAVAFSSCSGLTSVTIPNSVTSIGEAAFSSCIRLISANFLGNAPLMGGNVFPITEPSFIVYYLQGKKGFTSPIWNGYQCEAIGPEIDVQQPVGAVLEDNASTKNFGAATVGMSGNIKIFTIKNTGTADLKNLVIIKDGTNAGSFKVTAPMQNSLAPGTFTTFKVTFKPTAAGTRKAAIHIKSNDADESPFDIKLTGKGVAP